MSGPDSFAAGFEVPLHRSLTEPILLGAHRAPWRLPTARWPPPSGWACNCGFLAWCSGSSAIRWRYGARVDPQFMAVFARHIKHRPLLDVRDAAMLNLAEYRQRPALLADWLPWAGLVAPGVVLNKDGSFSARPGFAGLTSTVPRKAS